VWGRGDNTFVTRDLITFKNAEYLEWASSVSPLEKQRQKEKLTKSGEILNQ
tara:strand:- start:9260 stop:9412 length:153 start_codon:yes stop_codon:yes gene_type:complete